MTSDTKEHGEEWRCGICCAADEQCIYCAVAQGRSGTGKQPRPTPERPPHQREGGIAKEPIVFTHGLTLTAADIEEIAGTGPGPAVAAVCPPITQELREAMKIVNEQAEDEGLWFEAEYITESMLQAALRRLHAALEAAAKVETCTRVASYAGEKGG